MFRILSTQSLRGYAHRPLLSASTTSQLWLDTTRNRSTTTKTKKKYPGLGAVRADDGRVVLIQTSGKSGSSKPRLCTGCGTEVIVGTTEGVVGGIDAVKGNWSKRFTKQARFLDAAEATPYSHKHGAGQGFLCQRCKSLKDNNVWGAYDALRDVLPEVFQKQLRHIVSRRRFGMCILVVDATDPEHSAMKHVRKSIGKTQLWLVLSKVDLMPRLNPLDLRNIRFRIERMLSTKFVRAFAVSSITPSGVIDLCEAILANLGGRDVFLIGAANVGKTTLVRELAATIANSVKIKGKSGRRRRDIVSSLGVTGSNLPGTTLQAVRIPCFTSAGHAMWDTPGVINRKAVQYNIFPSHLMEPLTRPEQIPVPTRDNNLQSRIYKGESLLIEAAWMEYETGYIHPSVESFESKREQEDSDEDEPDFVLKVDHDRKQEVPKPKRLGDPAVLARLDFDHVEGGDNVFVQAWLHPSLRVRVCNTSDAPTMSTIPLEYQEFIEKKISRSVSNDKLSIPLTTFTDKTRKRGEFTTGDKEYTGSMKYAMDVCFASLGWLACLHESPFTVIPHVVEGSIVSKRRSMYPADLAQRMKNDPTEAEREVDDLDAKETGKRLRDAARVGRESGGRGGETDPRYGGHDNTGGFFHDGGSSFNEAVFDEDDWF